MEDPTTVSEGVGLSLSLDQYRPITVFPGGPTIVGQVYHSLIRAWQPALLGRFLPQAIPEESDVRSVLYVLRDENGQEVTSQSKPIGDERLPKREITNLLDAIQLLRNRGDSPDIED